MELERLKGMAKSLNCGFCKLPMMYLGMSLGVNAKREKLLEANIGKNLEKGKAVEEPLFI